MDESSVLVVLPTYNEALNIDEVLGRTRAAMPRAHVLVVDDNSPDGTAELAEEIGSRVGEVSLLRRGRKEGLGPAYRAGFAWGLSRGYTVLIEMDADLSHDPADLPRLVDAISAGADLAIGSRYVDGGGVPNWSWHRRWLSKWGNRYAAAMLGLNIRDVTAGFRAYRAEVLQSVDLPRVRADGYGFQIEMAYRAVRHGARVREVPIRFADRVRGASKMSSRVVAEALVLVTGWGLRDRLRWIRPRR